MVPFSATGEHDGESTQGSLAVPRDPAGTVVFALVSGRSRHSPANGSSPTPSTVTATALRGLATPTTKTEPRGRPNGGGHGAFGPAPAATGGVMVVVMEPASESTIDVGLSWVDSRMIGLLRRP